MKRKSSLKDERRRAGRWLKQLREGAGLTQMELATRLGLEYYTFVSQVETGFSRVPNKKIGGWARAVGADPSWFARQLIKFYEPELHRVLYPQRAP